MDQLESLRVFLQSVDFHAKYTTGNLTVISKNYSLHQQNVGFCLIQENLFACRNNSFDFVMHLNLCINRQKLYSSNIQQNSYLERILLAKIWE